MARKRMFSLDVIDTDVFIEMPPTSRLLYYELCMRADDDGFVGSPKKIQRIIGCSDDDLKILITKKFIIPFNTGVIAIRHWKLNNFLRKDRHTETIYKEEFKQLAEDENGLYKLNTENGQPNVDQMPADGQPSIDKSSIEENSIDKSSSSVNKYLYNSDVEKIQKAMIETIGTTNTNNIKECIDYLDKLPYELIEYALKKAARVERPSWQYTIPILESYIDKNFKTLEEVQADDLKHKTNNKNNVNKNNTTDMLKEILEEENEN